MQQILCEDLQKQKLYQWFVLYALTAKQKEERLNHTYGLTKTNKSDPNFLDFIITGDESWCFAYDQERQCQSSECCGPNTPRSKTFQF